jgi:hypothetical protein
MKSIDLKGGVLTPGLLTYGGYIGLSEIEIEPSTNDGIDYGLPPFDMKIPNRTGKEPLVQAVDGLQFQGRDTL